MWVRGFLAGSTMEYPDRHPLPSSSLHRGRLRLGFGAAVVLLLLLGVTSIFSLHSIIEVKDAVISQHSMELIDLEKLRLASAWEIASSRAFLLTGDADFLSQANGARCDFRTILGKLTREDPSPTDRNSLDGIGRAEDAYRSAMTGTIALRKEGEPLSNLISRFEEVVRPNRQKLRTAFDDFTHREETLLNEGLHASDRAAHRTMLIMSGFGVGSLLLAGGLFFLAQRTLDGLAQNERRLEDLNQHLDGLVRARTADLEATLNEQEAFAYTIAHDLRAPLRSITGFSQLLIEEEKNRISPMGRDYAERVNQSARRLDLLIQGLLAYSQLSRQEIVLAPVDLQANVDKACDTLRQSIADRKAHVEVQGPLPRVQAHELALSRVLENLISNAIKFVEPGVPPRVVIRAQGRGEWVRIWVEDNGIGIAPKHHDRIFGVFERLHPPEEYPGTGIGLAIVRRAVERMGGTSGVDSEPGKGSRFWFELKPAEAPILP